MSLPLSPCPLPPSNYLTPCTYPPQSLPPYPALLPTPLFPNLLLTLCLLQLLVTTLRVMGGGMSQVLDGLYLGNIRDAEDKATLSRNGIAHIVSVHNNAKPLLPEVTYLCIAASDSANQNLLAGVSRSTTILVAYLMTVTNFGWEDCLSAVKSVRSYVGPNFGFQQQLLEYQMGLVTEYRAWLRQEYGRNPFHDQDKVRSLISQHEEKEKLRQAQSHWINRPDTDYPLPYQAYGSCRRWTNR
ncbi:dual specificity protein phosphatase 22-A-like isoform X2 [Ascaphus truei]|uniref:dual specificity protein phosphatase 22-A-like isoform X2 n=1 Tax=Ascaphus truei TaxID=8439 RepID=UPI003F591034